MKHSTTLSMGTTVAGNPYLIQAAEYITPGLPYFAAIGIDDEDRHIRERVQTACETVGYAWPEGRTTLALMPTNQPKRPGLCALATAVCIMATAGTIGIPDLESTVILGDVNEDGTIARDENGDPIREDVVETPQAAMVSVGYDGSLKAIVGGIGEKEVSRGLNRGTVPRQVGSTMKPTLVAPVSASGVG